MNTKVTVTFSNGDTREFAASNELEELITTGEMFSITTMHPDQGDANVMNVSKMYAGNPVAALGNMMIMRRNAEMLDDGDANKSTIIEILNVCIGFMTDEITSHQSGLTDNIEGSVDDCEKCPATSKCCDQYIYQRDNNGEVAINHCKHPDNSSDFEGNCSPFLCPFCTEGGG
jgi:hypothetical protein